MLLATSLVSLLYYLLISLLSTETLHLAVLDLTEAVTVSRILHPGHLHPVPYLCVQGPPARARLADWLNKVM